MIGKLSSNVLESWRGRIWIIKYCLKIFLPGYFGTLYNIINVSVASLAAIRSGIFSLPDKMSKENMSTGSADQMWLCLKCSFAYNKNGAKKCDICSSSRWETFSASSKVPRIPISLVKCIAMHCLYPLPTLRHGTDGMLRLQNMIVCWGNVLCKQWAVGSLSIFCLYQIMICTVLHKVCL